MNPIPGNGDDNLDDLTQERIFSEARSYEAQVRIVFVIRTVIM